MSETSETDGVLRPKHLWVIGIVTLLWNAAVWVFLVSLISMAITAFQNYALSNGMEVIGDAFSLGFTAAIFLIALALYLYAGVSLRYFRHSSQL